ncbi:hypothetical protein D3C80_1524690 [compost metagenome]
MSSLAENVPGRFADQQADNNRRYGVKPWQAKLRAENTGKSTHADQRIRTVILRHRLHCVTVQPAGQSNIVPVYDHHNRCAACSRPCGNQVRRLQHRLNELVHTLVQNLKTYSNHDE